MRVVVDFAKHSVVVRVDEPAESYVCSRYYAPVYSMAVEFGPLTAGDWVFWSAAYQFTNCFTVFSDPEPPRFRFRIESGRVSLDWPTVNHRHDELETSTDLVNWHGALVEYELHDSVMSAQIKPEMRHQFFRVRRSPISQLVTSYPTDCGQ